MASRPEVLTTWSSHQVSRPGAKKSEISDAEEDGVGGGPCEGSGFKGSRSPFLRTLWVVSV